MNKDPIIEYLVDDLQAVTPFSDRRFWLGAISLYVIACFAIVLGMGFRSDFANAYQAGTLLLKPMLFLGIGVSAAWLANDIAKPQGKLVTHHSALAFLSIAVLCLLFFFQYQQSSHGWVYQSVASHYRQASGLHCFSSIFVGGAIFMGVAWFKWVSKTASNNVKWIGGLSGAAAGAFVASAYALHCTVDAAPYLLVYYLTPIVILAAAGYFAGGRYLKW